MPTLLHVIEDLRPGGATTQLRLLSQKAIERGEAVRVVALRYSGDSVRELQGLGVQVERVDRRFSIDPFACARLIGAVRRSRAEVVQSWDKTSARLCGLARRVVRFHWVHTHRHEGPPPVAVRRADRILQPAGEQVANERGASEQAAGLACVPNAFPEDWGQGADRHAARAALRAAGIDLQLDTPVIVTVARLDDRRAINELSWSADLVRVVCPGLRFLIAGEGPDRLACERFASAATQAGTIVWLGNWTDLRTLYAAADLVWVPKSTSSTPTAAIEAMAAGRPVQMAAGPGREQLLPSDGLARERQQPLAWNDRAGWARASMALLADSDLAANLGRANAEQVRQKHSIDRVAALHQQVIAETLASAS